MQPKLILTCTAFLAASALVLASGCDEYHAEESQPTTQQPPPQAAPGTGGERKSTLGRAYDAGERTRDRMDDYHQRVLEEAENVGEP